ncbi:MAG: signal peptidase I [Bacillota bacterium]|nr:signal peptidase I [Bacillota bacterium]
MLKKIFLKKYDFIFQFLFKTLILLIILFLLLSFVFKVHRATGNTMSPYIRDGDLCIFYRMDKIYLNDIIIYKDKDGKECMGRVIASRGQTVAFSKHGGYFVDGNQTVEENPYKTYASKKKNVKYPLKLKNDEYFVLNDFRKITTDSREKGAISKSQIKGKLLFLMRRRGF